MLEINNKEELKERIFIKWKEREKREIRKWEGGERREKKMRENNNKWHPDTS